MSDFEELQEIAAIIGKFPPPSACGVPWGSQLEAFLREINKLPGHPVASIIGASNAVSAFVWIPTWIVLGKEVWRKQLAALPFWRRWLSLLDFNAEPKRLERWYLDLGWYA